MATTHQRLHLAPPWARCSLVQALAASDGRLCKVVAGCIAQRPHASMPSHVVLQMGPSGSGKTTLLDLLAGRKTVGKTEGTISFAGQKPTQAFLRRYTGVRNSAKSTSSCCCALMWFHVALGLQQHVEHGHTMQYTQHGCTP